jgi:hypothetical protein
MVNSLLTKIFKQCPFGGNLNIYMAPMENSLLSFMHDECNVQQFISMDALAKLPKDKGNGIMGSLKPRREYVPLLTKM